MLRSIPFSVKFCVIAQRIFFIGESEIAFIQCQDLFRGLIGQIQMQIPLQDRRGGLCIIGELRDQFFDLLIQYHLAQIIVLIYIDPDLRVQLRFFERQFCCQQGEKCSCIITVDLRDPEDHFSCVGKSEQKIAFPGNDLYQLILLQGP